MYSYSHVNPPYIPQHYAPAPLPPPHGDLSEGHPPIIDVWADNLDEEMEKIIHIIEEYPYVAMDTEFPGVVARPTGFKTTTDYHYQTLKCNVDLLKIIQLGLCFYNEQGQRYPHALAWQFNFSFNLSKDMYAQDSIELLQQAGMDFKQHEMHGIDVQEFGAAMLTSGLVLQDNVCWISFHSGYDFGYLMKLLTCDALPKTEAEFFQVLTLLFPRIYDLKYMMKNCEPLNGGLNKLAADLGVKRIGPEHQAGSDSMVTGAAFFVLRSRYFEDQIDDDKFCGVLFGLGHNIKLNKNNDNNSGLNGSNTNSSGQLTSSSANASSSSSSSTTASSSTSSN